MAGLPGTGLGGIFYVSLVLWMLLRESAFAAKGASSRERWLRIGKLGSIAGAIVSALWLEGMALDSLVEHADLVPGPDQARTLAVQALTPALGFAPVVLLAILLISLHVARVVFRGGIRSAGARQAGRAGG